MSLTTSLSSSNTIRYFENEIYNLKNLKVIVALGAVAFNNCIRFYKRNYVVAKIDPKVVVKGCDHENKFNRDY